MPLWHNKEKNKVIHKRQSLVYNNHLLILQPSLPPVNQFLNIDLDERNCHCSPYVCHVSQCFSVKIILETEKLNEICRRKVRRIRWVGIFFLIKIYVIYYRLSLPFSSGISVDQYTWLTSAHRRQNITLCEYSSCFTTVPIPPLLL